MSWTHSARPPVRWPATLLPGRWWQQRPQSGGQGGSAGPTAPWRVLPGDGATAPELLGESWGTGTSPQGTGYAKPPPPGTATRPPTIANGTPRAREGQRASAAISRSWGCLDGWAGRRRSTRNGWRGGQPAAGCA